MRSHPLPLVRMLLCLALALALGGCGAAPEGVGGRVASLERNVVMLQARMAQQDAANEQLRQYVIAQADTNANYAAFIRQAGGHLVANDEALAAQGKELSLLKALVHGLTQPESPGK